MPSIKDGPSSPLFEPVAIRGNAALTDLASFGVSQAMAEAGPMAASGNCVFRGVPFRIGKVLLARDKPIARKFKPIRAPWLVFLHATDCIERSAGLQKATRGAGRLNIAAANYSFVYADGTCETISIRRRHQISMFRGGEACLQAVEQRAPRTVRAHNEQLWHFWGQSQTRAWSRNDVNWQNWLWAWENPHPQKAIVGLEVEPLDGPVCISGISAGKVASRPVRWLSRRKAVLRLPRGTEFDPTLDDEGLLKHVQMDMGQIISARAKPIYPNDEWARTYNNRVPDISEREVLLEYTAHEEARFHLPGGKSVPVAKVEDQGKGGPLRRIAPSTQRVTLRVVDEANKPVAVKLHIHGQENEYLPPVDRHRIINAAWFEDYSADYAHLGKHFCCYVPGETDIELPLGKIYMEISKGFEIRPIRKVFRVTKRTQQIDVTLKKVLPWRESGWVSADTHIHFVSPQTALLEGEAEGCNVVNLLATQLGELMTNAGDWDGKTTFGSKEAGGDGEYMVRVGTENRQHVLGHISLLGYEGGIIAPMTTGGPNESALGDPVGSLMTQWARQCKEQNGVVIYPHFPNPRGEFATSIVSGDVDAVEMTSLGQLYNGINPYSLSDWYRFLNCGYLVAAVGGTDKMSASTAIGEVRTYARIPTNKPFTYENWKDAIRRGETFVTYGPLVDFAVEGKPAGTWIKMPAKGGTVDVTWKAASVTIPMSRIELMVNGEIAQSKALKKWQDGGHFTVKVDRSSWIALLVRRHYADKPEIITAHTSPVMVRVKGSEFYSAADAVTILEQIEGVMAFVETVGTRAQTKAYREMMLLLTSVHRKLHNRMHQMGHFHEHSVTEGHPEHH